MADVSGAAPPETEACYQGECEKCGTWNAHFIVVRGHPGARQRLECGHCLQMSMFDYAPDGPTPPEGGA